MTGLSVGDRAPDFELRDQHGQQVRLSSYAGERAVLLIFYPFAFSRVCTSELVSLRERWEELDRDDVAVLVVSCDHMFSLRAYADRDALEFPLLSDFWPHGQVSTAYDVFDDHLGCARRSSYVVDRSGRIAWAVHSAMSEARDIDAYLRVLEGTRKTNSAANKLLT